MKDLSILPASIRERLEEAQQVSRQGHPVQASAIISEALVELARTSPDNFTTIVGKVFGDDELYRTDYVLERWVERIDHQFFGMTYHTELVPMYRERFHDQAVGLRPRKRR